MKPPNYTQVPNLILESLHAITPAECKVVMVICRQTFGWQNAPSRRERERSISLNELSQRSGLSRQGVMNSVSALIERGWIKRYETGQSFAYEVSLEVDQQPVNSVDQLSNGNQSTQLTRPVNSVDQQPVNSVDPSIKKEKKKNKETSIHLLKPEGESEIPKELDTPEFRDRFSAFSKDRKDRKIAMTSEARRLILKKMAPWGAAAACQALDNSMENGWRGVFEPKNQAGASAPTRARVPLDDYNPYPNEGIDKVISPEEAAAARARFRELAKAQREGRLP